MLKKKRKRPTRLQRLKRIVETRTAGYFKVLKLKRRGKNGKLFKVIFVRLKGNKHDTERELAFSIANEAHAGQKRKLGDDKGMPYIVHPIRVSGHFTDDTLCAAALLHDVVEDTKFDAAVLVSMGVKAEVVNLVIELTRRSDENYLQYILRIRDNPRAAKIKLADLHDNMQSLPEASLLDKYRLAEYILLNP